MSRNPDALQGVTLMFFVLSTSAFGRELDSAPTSGTRSGG